MDHCGPIVEQTTGVVTCQLVTEDAVTHVQKANILTATLSLIDEVTGTVINSWDKKDAMSLIDADGLFTWELDAADTTLLTATGTPARVYHRAILVVTGSRTGGGTWVMRYRFRIGIDNWTRIE